MSLKSNNPIKDPEALLERIRVKFPKLQWKTYQYIDEGFDHEVIILDKKLVFRFPIEDDYRTQLKDEIATLKQLRPYVRIKIPDYSYVADDKSFAGYELINGTALTATLFNSLSDSDQHAIAQQLASFMSTLHSLISKGYDATSLPLSIMNEDQAYLKTQTTRHLKPILSEVDYALTQKILADIDSLLSKKLPQVFIHGDIYHNHLLWNKQTKELSLIDFSDMNIGDPAFDFAELYEYGQDFIEEVYQLYEGQKDVAMLERAWKYQCWVAVYIMIDHFDSHKTSFTVARETFDRIKKQLPSYVLAGHQHL